MYQYKHHKTSFVITTSDIADNALRLKVNYAITNTFQSFIKDNSDNVQLEFLITDSIDKFLIETDFVRVKDIRIGSAQTYFRDNELAFLVNHSAPFRVIVNVINNETFKSSLRIFNKGFKNAIEAQISTFYYRVFLLFSQLWNIQNNLSYLHSSAVSLLEKSIIFTADSGVGKSSLLVKLSEVGGFSFVADDLTVISSNSKAFHQGRSLSIKPYHFKQYPFLRKKITSLMKFGQRLQWLLLNDNRLTYRVSPSEFFEEISTSSDIKRVVHLCNHSAEDFIISDFALSDLVECITPILINELFLANHKLNTLASLPNSPFIHTSILYRKVRDIYLKAFKNVEIKLVLVPYMSDSNDLYNFLKSEGCLN